MSLSDIRALQAAKYKKHLVENVFKKKYINMFEDDVIKRSAFRIVRKLKKTWFKDNYNAQYEKGLLIYTQKSNPKSGLYNFRVNDICLNMEDINDIDEIFKDNSIRKSQYIHQLKQINFNETIGYNSLQNWEYEKTTCYDSKTTIELYFYLNYITKTFDTLINSFDIELIINVKNEIMKNIIEYYTKNNNDIINDFEIFEKNCVDIYNKLTVGKNNINRYLNNLLIINNISIVKNYLKSSNYNYNWLINAIDSYKDYDTLYTFNLNKLNTIIHESTYKYLHDINRTDKLIECQCCYNKYCKSDLIFDDDFIYCHKCSEIFYGNNITTNNSNNNEYHYNINEEEYSDNEYNNEEDSENEDNNNSYNYGDNVSTYC